MTKIPSTKAKEYRKEHSRAAKNRFFFGLSVAHGIPRARERTAADRCAGEEEEEHGGLAMGLKLFGLWRKPGDCRGEAPGVDVGQIFSGIVRVRVFRGCEWAGMDAMAAHATLGNARANKRRIYATIMHEEHGRRKGRSNAGVGLGDL
ncbi:unnamed protein product [Sphagnum jensenii]|uniref:Uncharacterized protein n=1 Tax=Sphagnum jensenii TaxID=128206 RepID=A0ABP1A8E9_9BRYO